MLNRHTGVFWRLTLVLGIVALAAVALSGKLGPMQGGALIMLPALLLAAVMLTRPYPGERVIAKLRVRQARRRRGVAQMADPVRPCTHTVRGGRLIAVALAGRAPPLALVDRR